METTTMLVITQGEETLLRDVFRSDEVPVLSMEQIHALTAISIRNHIGDDMANGIIHAWGDWEREGHSISFNLFWLVDQLREHFRS